MRLKASLALVCLSFAVACASHLRPTAPTAVDATGRRSCGADGPQGAAEPLVVDLPPESRSDLEVSMEQRVSVVAWDCKSLRVLPECYVEGRYQFRGTSPKEQLVRLVDANDVQATLPLSGSRLAGEIGADFQSGTSLDLALIMIGKRTTTRFGITTDDLRGNCAGASHIVKSATLGAFTLATGERAAQRSVAELFGANVAIASRSGKTAFLRDGTLGACQSGPAADAPANCNAALRLELLPIAVPEAPMTAIDESTAASFRGKLCPDLGDCEQRCDASDAKACSDLMILYAIGDRVRRDLGISSVLGKRACDLGDMNACTMIALSLMTSGPHNDLERGRAYMNRACDRGVPTACATLAISYRNSGDAPLSRDYAQRACTLGHTSSCR